MMIQELLHKKEILNRKISFLLSEYKEYQSYFNNRTPEEAEMKYYCEKFEESGYESEGLFSLHHTQLFQRMEENRSKRNNLASQIKQIKLNIKQYHRGLKS